MARQRQQPSRDWTVGNEELIGLVGQDPSQTGYFWQLCLGKIDQADERALGRDHQMRAQREMEPRRTNRDDDRER